MPNYVSIIGSDLIQPLASILDKFLNLLSKEKGKRHGDERGYSASICLLIAVIVESFAMKARYLNESEESAKEKSLYRFMSREYPEFEFADQLLEVFILRDVIAHNHLWMIESSSDRDIWTDILRKKMHPLTDRWRDKKYRDYVDIEIARTKTLSLHVIPTQIDRTDVSKVLKVAKGTLDFLLKREGPILGVNANLAEFRGMLLNLPGILEEAIQAI